MRATVNMEITREMLVSMLTAYAKSACPSAMLKILAEALANAADDTDTQGRTRDAEWLRLVSGEMLNDVEALRADENAIYLENAPIGLDLRFPKTGK